MDLTDCYKRLVLCRRSEDMREQLLKYKLCIVPIEVIRPENPTGIRWRVHYFGDNPEDRYLYKEETTSILGGKTYNWIEPICKREFDFYDEALQAAVDAIGKERETNERK